MPKRHQTMGLLCCVLIIIALALSIGQGAAWQGIASPEASPGASPSASPAASPVAGSGAVELHAIDIDWQEKELRIPANTDVQVTVINVGALPHDFIIDELGVSTSEVPGGGSETVTINAAPGTYEYYCAVPGHKEFGMVGTLIVE
jgi:nitrite reductase (NO-forming)